MHSYPHLVWSPWKSVTLCHTMWATLGPETGPHTPGFGRVADALATRPSLSRFIMPNLVVWGERKECQKSRSPKPSCWFSHGRPAINTPIPTLVNIQNVVGMSRSKTVSGRLHVPIVGPTGRSEWSVRLVGPTIVSCKRFVRPSDRRSKNQTCLISSDRLSDRSDEAFTRYDRRTDQSDRPVGPTGRSDDRNV